MLERNEEILQIAMEQSAIDLNCDKEDFLKLKNKVVFSKQNEKARKYLKLPFYCNLVSYGNNIVASVDREMEQIVTNYMSTYPIEHCFETPNLHILNEELEKKGKKICFMAEYFLPDRNALKELPCEYPLKVMTTKDFTNLYTGEWSNALSERRKEDDVLGVAAFDGDKMIGLAGCSADCDTMWQIGIDIKPEYRRQGIASALTSRLALEILKLGKVPFYCTAWSNIKSVRNALRSGFRPAWVEMTAKSLSYVNKMNQRDSN